MEQHHQNSHHMDHGNHDMMDMPNEVNVEVTYDRNKLTVYIEDMEKKPVKLKENHEKMIHLIVVSDDLEQFYHLHPDQTDEHRFETEIKLASTTAYKAFVDISVEGKNYKIKPIPINSANHNDQHLRTDDQRVKVIEGQKIELTTTPFVVKEPVTISFDIDGVTPDPYLGALGHVVIVDEKLLQFIHVHPKFPTETVFEAHFNKSGTYKLWAEFKINQKVIAFPYVFQVSEQSTIQ
ncbi:hypothetical protein [Aquibacillus salsiterrae]|uniref:Secreted protein n=1 Tax=Aquibacillus salsiterrae TaxID=2950439 RepID=A0A9X4AES3_9BACI|nr:hypothetical protein [Aquibacillus salsiterrae]MDC3415298.1 hypothetical protein [Aquibacillus salsiterrae]